MLTVLGVLLLVIALFLIVSVLMQHGKAKNLSGSIAGGAETFFGKTKGSTIDKMLSKITSVVAVVFVIMIVIVYVTQDTAVEQYKSFSDAINTPVASDTVPGDDAVTDAVDAAEDTQPAETEAAE